MKIILLKSQDNLGNVGDIVSVKGGYARNFLIPKKIASIASKENISSLKSWIEQESKKEANNRKNMELLAKYLDKLTLKFDLQAGEDGKLFGSVTSQMISDEIEKQGYSVDKKEIILEEPLKQTGNHFVHVDLGQDLKPKIKIKISEKK
jgi:large subunit ribosomal protein L9